MVLDLLVDLAFLDGALLIIVGAFYVYAAAARQSRYPLLAALLGAALICLGLGLVINWRVGGLTLFLGRGGNPAYGWWVVTARVVTALVVLGALVTSVVIWWREQYGGKR